MPSIQFYADDEDFHLLLERLASDPEVAVILPLGRHKWLARQGVGVLEDGRYCLWHLPAGPLPLLSEKSSDPPSTVENPFAGWRELRVGGIPGLPYFGSTPSIIDLSIRRRSTEAPGGIGQSSFGWLGDRYKSIGVPASKETHRWWRSLRQFVASQAARKITRWGPIHGPDADIWAFPSAYAKLASGIHRDMNPPI